MANQPLSPPPWMPAYGEEFGIKYKRRPRRQDVATGDVREIYFSELPSEYESIGIPFFDIFD